MSKNNRAKGHNLERDVANALREIGMKSTKTSRAASKLYDDCGIDHWGAVLPNGQYILTQCKMGYKKARPKADVEFKNQNTKLQKHFPRDSPELNPDNIQVLIHKMDGFSEYNNLVTIKYKDFITLLKSYHDTIRTLQGNQ